MPLWHSGDALCTLVVHTLPQLPQLPSSVFESTQPAPHLSSPPVQSKPQVPLLHTEEPPEGGLQALVQVPQWLVSVFRLVSQPLARLPSQSP